MGGAHKPPKKKPASGIPLLHDPSNTAYNLVSHLNTETCNGGRIRRTGRQPKSILPYDTEGVVKMSRRLVRIYADVENVRDATREID